MEPQTTGRYAPFSIGKPLATVAFTPKALHSKAQGKRSAALGKPANNTTKTLKGFYMLNPRHNVHPIRRHTCEGGDGIHLESSPDDDAAPGRRCILPMA